jgi:hypothetical protein
VENPVENVENFSKSAIAQLIICGCYVYQNLPLVVSPEEVSICNLSVNMPNVEKIARRTARFLSGIFGIGLL